MIWSLPVTATSRVLAGPFDEPFLKKPTRALLHSVSFITKTNKCRSLAFPHKKYEQYASQTRFLTAYFAGGAHIIRREVFDKIGLYPTDFHYGMEEYELSYRMLNAGYTIGYDSSVTVAHKESPLGRPPGYKKLQMQWINKSKVAYRYLPFKYFVTTALAWSVQYLKLSKGHFGTFFASWLQIIKIPFTEKRTTVSKATLAYLHKVQARLKY